MMGLAAGHEKGGQEIPVRRHLTRQILEAQYLLMPGPRSKLKWFGDGEWLGRGRSSKETQIRHAAGSRNGPCPELGRLLLSSFLLLPLPSLHLCPCLPAAQTIQRVSGRQNQFWRELEQTGRPSCPATFSWLSMMHDDDADGKTEARHYMQTGQKALSYSTHQARQRVS